MNNPSRDSRATVFCGIDVSAATLAVAVIEQDQAAQQREFPNQPAGHKQLLLWLAKCQACVRVSLEATGIYSLDLALALDAAPQVEVAVLNPKLVNRFAQTREILFRVPGHVQRPDLGTNKVIGAACSQEGELLRFRGVDEGENLG